MAEILSERYELLEELGGRGEAVEYRARHVLLQTSVRVRLLPATLAPARRAALRILIQAALRLPFHRNIVRVLDSAEQDGRLYVVEEDVGGRTLSDLLRGRIDRSTALAIAEQLADALTFAHAHGVVHGDLSAANVYLAPGNTPRVLLAGFGFGAEGRQAANDEHDLAYLLETVAADDPSLHTALRAVLTQGADSTAPQDRTEAAPAPKPAAAPPPTPPPNEEATVVLDASAADVLRQAAARRYAPAPDEDRTVLMRTPIPESADDDLPSDSVAEADATREDPAAPRRSWLVPLGAIAAVGLAVGLFSWSGQTPPPAAPSPPTPAHPATTIPPSPTDAPTTSSPTSLPGSTAATAPTTVSTETTLPPPRQLTFRRLVPSASDIAVKPGEAIEFTALTDAAGEQRWKIDGQPSGVGESLTFLATRQQRGTTLTIGVTAEHENASIEHEWRVTVVQLPGDEGPTREPAESRVAMSVGSAMTFSVSGASGEAAPAGHAWTVDGRPVTAGEAGERWTFRPSSPGTYEIAVARTAASGAEIDRVSWQVTVRKPEPNQPPRIVSSTPAAGSVVTVPEDGSATFTVRARDPNTGDQPRIVWLLGGGQAARGTRFVFRPRVVGAGEAIHLEAEVSDARGLKGPSVSWTIRIVEPRGTRR